MASAAKWLFRRRLIALTTGENRYANDSGGDSPAALLCLLLSCLTRYSSFSAVDDPHLAVKRQCRVPLPRSALRLCRIVLCQVARHVGSDAGWYTACRSVNAAYRGARRG